MFVYHRDVREALFACVSWTFFAPQGPAVEALSRPPGASEKGMMPFHRSRLIRVIVEGLSHSRPAVRLHALELACRVNHTRKDLQIIDAISLALTEEQDADVLLGLVRKMISR